MNPAGYFHPVTGAQVKGPQWTGQRRPTNPRPKVLSAFARTSEQTEHNAAVDARKGRDLAVDPAGRLAQLLAHPGATRSLRRLVLAVVQMPEDTPRRRRLNRRANRLLRDAGVLA